MTNDNAMMMECRNDGMRFLCRSSTLFEVGTALTHHSTS